MELVKSSTVAYGFTVKDNRVDTTDYRSFFERCEKMGCPITHKYSELDSKGKLHYHGIINIPKGFYRKRLMVDGLHLKLVELFDHEGWLKYCQKAQEALEPDCDELIEMCTPLCLKRRIV